MSLEHHHRGGDPNAPPCGKQHLQLDQACLQIITSDHSPPDNLIFKAQSLECQGCPLWIIQDHLSNGSEIIVNATYPTRWALSKSGGSVLCQSDKDLFGQYGHYGLNLTADNKNCHLEILQEPTNAFLPILWAFMILAIVQVVWIGLKRVYNSPRCRQFMVGQWLRYVNSSDNFNQFLANEADNQENLISTEELDERAKKKKRRVKSLDAFRGLAIVIMIFVNYGGGGYYFFAHSKWNGLTVADLVFPWFMWIMGVSLAISIQSQLRNSRSRSELVMNILRRSAILFFLGLIINSLGGHNDLRLMRIPGVLQRFAVAYLVVGLMQTLLASRELSSLGILGEDNAVPWWWVVRDIKDCLVQWFVMISMVIVHTCLTFLLPVPGCPPGYLGPGGLHDGGKFQNCTGGSARIIDNAIFGRKHIYTHPSAKPIYDTTEPYDPEGSLGSLTSVFIVFLGVQCGYTLLTFNDWKPRVKRWLSWAVVLGSIAGALCGFSKNDGIIPINKNLWSLSFVIGMAAMAFFLLTIMYLLIDVVHVWQGGPLLYAGMNSILLYVGHETCEDFFPFSWQPYTQSHAELLFMNLWGMSLWVFISYVLYKKQMFLAL